MTTSHPVSPFNPERNPLACDNPDCDQLVGMYLQLKGPRGSFRAYLCKDDVSHLPFDWKHCLVVEGRLLIDVFREINSGIKSPVKYPIREIAILNKLEEDIEAQRQREIEKKKAALAFLDANEIDSEKFRALGVDGLVELGMDREIAQKGCEIKMKKDALAIIEAHNIDGLKFRKLGVDGLVELGMDPVIAKKAWEEANEHDDSLFSFL